MFAFERLPLNFVELRFAFDKLETLQLTDKL